MILTGLLSLSGLCICMILSITFGTKSVGYQNILDALQGIRLENYQTSVVQSRIPRMVFGVIAGAALSISGAMMQSVTRNPIADPSILGVNTGASLFVVCGMSFFHITSPNQYIWCAFAGAALTALLVYGLASTGHGGATPMKLALAGTAAGTALQSLVNTVMLPDSQVMDQFRFWQTGNIGGASWSDIRLLLPYFAAGFLLSICMAPFLNALALGDETATSLGVNVTAVRGLSALAGVLLCASTTALAGPIGFISLMIPHLVRLVLGPDMRVLLPFSALLGSCLLLIADLAGRILGRPGEIESGIITALMGAPVFILIIRKGKVYGL
ncbi:MAG: iron ABC transporter permease [Eubacteriales bacterium]|nr:iron ABC transporter permease [Eubacteriales bacterium]